MLHIVNSSPTQTNTLADCLKRVSAGNGLLLIENGVYGALDSEINQKLLQMLPENFSLNVLESDLLARGLSLSELDPRFSVVDYEGFVRLVERFPVTHSWF